MRAAGGDGKGDAGEEEGPNRGKAPAAMLRDHALGVRPQGFHPSWQSVPDMPPV